MKKEVTITPVAFVRNDFKEKFGIPRQSGRAPSVRSAICFERDFQDEAFFREIEGFSHLWLIFDFSATREQGYAPTVRPPRLGGNRRVGVFASRSPFRPNHLGLSVVKLEEVRREKAGVTLVVSGARGGYADEHKNERLEVEFPSELLDKIPQEKREGLIECLADDPRPSYQDDPDRVYGMRFGNAEIRFRVIGNRLTVEEVTI
ncbi:MAG: tRNA (N6-threonylcarbamoyladenosine(37)-N6)-methyltransferase TrmO [Clostridia bacterium]|nr:tRNA (N6-threonylcarbamoyladenosine(37)-N6)-methyltransferase TrmO [Clostridia bacterium]